MIESLEIKNFESHKHTVLKDFSPGFNLICGRSNQGKTSILRALKAVCFNEFNPRSIRVGEKFCEITLVTDKGKVYVKKGPKDNHWETTKNGETTKEWDKVGKGLPDDVAEITGMRTVNLGGIEFNANFMDQLSAHFMLASIDDQKASPSDRVRIIDAVSGLTGVEGLIRSVSLANKGAAKAIGDCEKEIDALKNQKHNEMFLESEGGCLLEAENAFRDAEAVRKDAEFIKSTMDDIVAVEKGVASSEGEMARLPDLTGIDDVFSECIEDCRSLVDGERSLQGISQVAGDIESLQKKADSLPDVDLLFAFYEKAEEGLRAEEACRGLLNDLFLCEKSVKEKEGRLSGLPDVEVLEMMIRKIESANVVVVDGERMKEWIMKGRSDLKEKEARLEEVEKEEAELEKEVHELLEGVEICPFCGQKVGLKEQK